MSAANKSTLVGFIVDQLLCTWQFLISTGPLYSHGRRAYVLQTEKYLKVKAILRSTKSDTIVIKFHHIEEYQRNFQFSKQKL
jgi:hypothetical protein